jgi:hypothetical protein
MTLGLPCKRSRRRIMQFRYVSLKIPSARLSIKARRMARSGRRTRGAIANSVGRSTKRRKTENYSLTRRQRQRQTRPVNIFQLVLEDGEGKKVSNSKHFLSQVRVTDDPSASRASDQSTAHQVIQSPTHTTTKKPLEISADQVTIRQPEQQHY